MNNAYKLFMASIASILLFGCGTEVQNENVLIETKANALQSEADEQSNSKKENSLMKLVGTVTYLSFEGGFYGFIAKDGAKYTINKLSDEYRKNGLIIEIIAEPIYDMATTTQFGTLLNVHSIKVLDDSKVEPILQNNLM